MHEMGTNHNPSGKMKTLDDADLDSLLASLRSPEDLSPRPGFYARVMDRVDSSATRSIWTVFLEPLFGRRLVMASAALMLVLGMALFVPSSEVEDELFARTQAPVHQQVGSAAASESYAFALDGRDKDKDGVLINLVTYQEH